MARWRKKARALLPDMPWYWKKSSGNIYQFFFELNIFLEIALVADDVDALRRIFAFAHWALHHRTKDIWNAAGVVVYEHLFDQDEILWPKITPWLPPEIIKEVYDLWSWYMPTEKMAQIDKVLAQKHEHRYLEYLPILKILKDDAGPQTSEPLREQGLQSEQ